jgi:hypothetical protein
MNQYTYQIDPRPADFGGGWQLRLLENGEEVGGGAFPLAYYYSSTKNAEEAASYAYEDALSEACLWVESRVSNP